MSIIDTYGFFLYDPFLQIQGDQDAVNKAMTWHIWVFPAYNAFVQIQGDQEAVNKAMRMLAEAQAALADSQEKQSAARQKEVSTWKAEKKSMFHISTICMFDTEHIIFVTSKIAARLWFLQSYEV